MNHFSYVALSLFLKKLALTFNFTCPLLLLAFDLTFAYSLELIRFLCWLLGLIPAGEFKLFSLISQLNFLSIWNLGTIFHAVLGRNSYLKTLLFIHHFYREMCFRFQMTGLPLWILLKTPFTDKGAFLLWPFQLFFPGSGDGIIIFLPVANRLWMPLLEIILYIIQPSKGNCFSLWVSYVSFV